MLETGRWHDVADQFKTCDALGLVGTCCSTDDLVTTVGSQGRWWKVQWGRGARCTGLGLLLHRKAFARACIRTPVGSLDPLLKGR
eukprot:9799668-Heterocapsa_arctica.AAC.1